MQAIARRRLSVTVASVAAVTLSALWVRFLWVQAPAEQVVPAVLEDGVAPFRLGDDLVRTAALALPFDQAASYVGPGCDDRDQVTVVLPVGKQEMTVMAMAEGAGIIDEVIATPAQSVFTQTDRASCLARTREFAHALGLESALTDAMIEIRNPVSDEFHIPFGSQAHVVGRWFPGGRSCDLALVFKRAAASR